MKLDEMEERDRCNEDAEPENTVTGTEKGDTLTRVAYKDGSSGWVSERIQLSEHDQDALEEAYDLGVKAAGRNAQTMFSLGYGKGAHGAAKRGGKR